MEKYEKKYCKIIDKYIKESFRELKDFLIEVEEVDNTSYYALADYSKPKVFTIKISKKIRKWSDIEVRAMLAHELGHFVVYSKIGYHLTKLSDFFEERFRFWKRIQERKADKIAVEKGYGKYMVKSRSMIKGKKEIKKKKPIYMTVEEIKSYAKKIGEW